MLELVAMTREQKCRPSFKIMPVMLGMTLSQCLDANNHERWSSSWRALAKNDSRIDLKEWEDALGLFGPTNALKYKVELGEVKFRDEIVEAVCALVPPQTRFEDSHIQGRSRLCKLIRESIEKSKMSSSHEVRVVGLYGVGGIGKTTICKAMCNELSEEYRNKVAYVELGSSSEEEILREVLVKLTDKNLLGKMDVAEYRHHLMKDMMNAKVFLTIDNVSSTTTTQALTLLRAKYAHGSVVLVTARSLPELRAVRIDAGECMEMPELEMEEARSLFLYRASCVPSTYLSNKDDLELISSCVKQCHFQKGDDTSYHYHPLALQALGEQLGCVGYDRERWRSALHDIDFLNPFHERVHPVFSILRSSFDALQLQDRHLFMDAALFVPYNGGSFSFNWNGFDWLGLVHGIPAKSVKERLENLKRKSLVENLGDGFGRIGIHDLWLDFARLETKVSEFEKKRWVFEWDESNALDEASVTDSGRSVNVRRMFFLEEGFVKLKDVDFACFPNLTVLKLRKDLGVVNDLVLDLTGLKILKSLELDFFEDEPRTWIRLVGLGSLLKLGFLRWWNIPSESPCIDEISCLTNLVVLDLSHCGRLPDLSRLVSLQAAVFYWNPSVVTLTGLSSKHTNLQFLELRFCSSLQSCPGVSELVALQELRLSECPKLKELPNLHKLNRLRKLNVFGCRSLTGLPGLGDLVSLEELNANGCRNLAALPDMGNLQNLRLLDLSECVSLESLPGLNALVGLESLEMTGCKNLTQLPEMSKLTNLRSLGLDLYTPSQFFTGLGGIGRDFLRGLPVGFDEVHDGLDLSRLTEHGGLRVSGSLGPEFCSLAELVLLKSFSVSNCQDVRVLPDLERLSRLRHLQFSSCGFEDFSCLTNVTSLKSLRIQGCTQLEALPVLQGLAGLVDLRVDKCARLRDVRGILGLRSLEELWLRQNPQLHGNLGPDFHGLPSLRRLYMSDCGFKDLPGLSACSQLSGLTCRKCPIQELPDLAHFPALGALSLEYCANLTKLICTGPVSPRLSRLNFRGCTLLQALPDLTNSEEMEQLDVSETGVVLSAEVVQDMKARWPSIRLFPEVLNAPGVVRGGHPAPRILKSTLGYSVYVEET